MYRTCLFCHGDLGTNREIESFPIGRRLAYDAAQGRLWVVCRRCERWNLTPVEERWEALEECERRFRGTRLRVSTENIGLARLTDGLELVRIGPALLPELAAWRYGSRLAASGRALAKLGLHRGVAALLARSARRAGLGDDAQLKMRTVGRADAVLARAVDAFGGSMVIRFRHLGAARLRRPERDEPWRLHVAHDRGEGLVADSAALHTAGKLLATLNLGVAQEDDVAGAIARLDHAADPEGYFTRVAALALRTSWGRHPEAIADPRFLLPGAASDRSVAERLAIHLTSRSFWGRGGTGSEEETALFRLPVVDRLALEMAANEDFERRALHGELRILERAWREAEEIAAIADHLLDEPPPGAEPSLLAGG